MASSEQSANCNVSSSDVRGPAVTLTRNKYDYYESTEKVPQVHYLTPINIRVETIKIGLVLIFLIIQFHIGIRLLRLKILGFWGF